MKKINDMDEHFALPKHERIVHSGIKTLMRSFKEGTYELTITKGKAISVSAKIVIERHGKLKAA